MLLLDNIHIEETDKITGMSEAYTSSPALSDEWEIYPNPARDHIKIKNSLSGQVAISSLDGRTKLLQQYNTGEIIDISTLKSGAYIVRFSGESTNTEIIFKE